MRGGPVAVLAIAFVAHESLAQALVARDELHFRNAARSATARFRDIDVARAEGFKRVGVEFPLMGEHWVNLARVMDNRFDPAAPSVLTYVMVRGQRRLAGVAYTALLQPGEKPPVGPAPVAAWHEHNGSVAEESFPIHSAMSGTHAPNEGEPRLSILHAWVWASNPAGLFVTDNTDLPFLRLGTDRRDIRADAMRAASLALDSSGYHELMVETGLRPTRSEWQALEGVIQRHRSRAADALRSRPQNPDEVELVAIWEALWRALAAATPSRARQIDALRLHWR